MPSQYRGRGSIRPEIGSSFARRLHVEALEDRRLLAVFSVDNLDDSGAGSLRDAIAMANADTVADEITFSVTGTIDLVSFLSITEELTIDGGNQITLDAGGGGRIFVVSDSDENNLIDVTLRGLTLTGGNASGSDDGGAIFNFENLTVSSSSLFGNSGEDGGAILNRSGARLAVVDSVLYGNTASRWGGAIVNFGTTMVRTSTLSGNTALLGGGIYSLPASPGVTVTGSTITKNTAQVFGGGIRAPGTAHVLGSIVAGNTAGTSGDNVLGSLDTDINNLIDVDPLLGPLADNGGPTKTHALLPGSPALDAGLAPVLVYELDGSLAEAMGGTDLVALGGTLTAGGYEFEANEGLNLSSDNAPADDYTIEIDFSFDALVGFQKIIDFKDLVADAGLYTLNDTLRFFGPSFSSESILTVDTLHHLVFSRDGSTEEVRASIDGTEAFRFIDTGDAAVFSTTEHIIRFFQDDNATLQGEAESGFVDRIRFFDTALESIDQRGAMFNRVAGSAIDIGAYEAQSAPSADFDTDGDVDGSDFLTWQRGFGKANAQRSDGNSDDDTDTDASDLAAWITAFGQEATPLVASVEASGQPAGRNEELLDAAIALTSVGAASEEAKSLPFDETSAIETAFAERETQDNRLTSASFAETDLDASSGTSRSNTEESERADESWLAEELLLRVFG